VFDFLNCIFRQWYLSLISNFRRVLNIVCVLLCISAASDCGLPTFRNPLSVPYSKAPHPAFEDGTDREFRNFGKPHSDAGEIPKKTYTNGIYYYKCSTCFRRFLRPSSGAQKCIHSIGYLSSFFCFVTAIVGASQLHPNIENLQQNSDKKITEITTEIPSSPPISILTIVAKITFEKLS